MWEKAHALAVAVHALTEHVPRKNNTELIDQLRRAALSIPANIVEGAGSATDKDFARFLRIAFASANELEYHLQFAADTGAIPQAVSGPRQAEVIEIRKMLMGLIRRATGQPRPPASV
ncbi:MAG TPA: four helix bundle protein [Gemmatimonadaceae bacterium]|nr:four helix bundle protein [Gemmatimonadaceae bacterium]